MNDVRQLWAIVGATGTGKTELSLRLAQRLRELGRNPEIINADAMQFYRGMDIGTAKLPRREREMVPHHLFDVLEPRDEATVAWYQPAAREIITQIHDRQGDAILVGGSGLYVSSVLFSFDFPPRDEQLRQQLEEVLARDGVTSLVKQLQAHDPEAAAAVDTRNPRRVLRALEIVLLGGKAQVTLPEAPELWHPQIRILGTRVERSALVTNLDKRVHDMWAAGIVDEVRGLIPRGITEGKTASRAIGYAQALAQLRGDITEAAAIEETQLLTRRYARRQVSWFRRYADVTWCDGEHHSSLIKFVDSLMNAATAG